MYCVNCGKKLESSYKFCPKCGAKVSIEHDLYEDIISYVEKMDTISVTQLKDKFNLSQVKASEYINKLESDNIVGPSNGRKPREVLKKSKEERKDNIFTNDILDTEDTTELYEKEDIKNNTFMALLSYVSFLVFIPYFANNNSKYVKYHAIQGMNLFILWCVYAILNNLLSLIKVDRIITVGDFRAARLVTPWFISYPMYVIGVLFGICSVIGIIYVCEGKAKELPLIGKVKIVK